jgi:hypothetical protein
MAPPELNRQRALLIMEKIDEILFWEKTKEQRRVSTTLRHMHREFIEFYFLCWAAC